MPALPVQLAAVGVSLKLIEMGWPQLSVAVATPVLLVPVESPQANTLSAGQVMTGLVVSLNVMCWMQLALFWQASTAVQVRSMPALPVQLAAVGAWLKVIESGFP